MYSCRVYAVEHSSSFRPAKCNFTDKLSLLYQPINELKTTNLLACKYHVNLYLKNGLCTQFKIII